MGYGPEDKNAVVELTYNYGITEYDKGNGYAQVNSLPFLAAYFSNLVWTTSISFLPIMLVVMTISFSSSSGFFCVIVYERLNVVYFYQIAIGTDDVYKSAEAIKLSGGKITLEPGPLPGINTKITTCLDPDGWKLV